jgi:hypothetical protein
MLLKLLFKTLQKLHLQVNSLNDSLFIREYLTTAFRPYSTMKLKDNPEGQQVRIWKNVIVPISSYKFDTCLGKRVKLRLGHNQNIFCSISLLRQSAQHLNFRYILHLVS